MTSAQIPHSSDGPAAAIQLRAAEWVMEQTEANIWTETRQQALDEWLSQSPSHLLAYWRLKATWQRTHRLAALRSEPLGAHRALKKKQSNWPLNFRALAATGAAAAVASRLLWQPGEAPDKIYSTPVGGRETISLTDGSRIELNTATQIRVRPRGRTVELIRGEAYFQIHHDSLRPFTVLASGHRVTDLGTKFLMRADHGRLQVTLLDGSIRFESASANARTHSEILKPGDVAVATASFVSISQRRPQALVDASAWRKGMLVFRDTTLASAVAEFNRYNQQKLSVAGTRASNVKIDGTFHAENVSGFTNMVEHVLELKVRKRGQEFVISE